MVTDHLISLLIHILKIHLKLVVIELMVLLIVANLYGGTILHLQYCHSQGGITIIGANQEKTIKLPISFQKWYAPSSVIRYDYKNRPNINMMCTYAGVVDLSNIYLATDIIRNEDIGVPLTVFWYASGI